MSLSQVHFRGMYALRFFAAFLIILYHTTAGFHASMSDAYRLFFQNLVIGVDLFFLISGFLIIYLLLEEKKNTQSIHLGKFYLRRILRIFPLYFLIVGLAFVLYRSEHPDINFSRYLYFWGNFYTIEINNWPFGILTPLWSVCIEEHFYLVIPFLILITPLRWVHWVLVGVILASMGYRYGQLPIENWYKVYCHSLSRCDLMAVGGLLACYHSRKPVAFSINVWWPLALTLLVLVVAMTHFHYSDYGSVFNAVFKKYVFALPLLLCIIWLVFNTHSTVAFFEHPVLQYLGKISYGLYMFHIPVNEFMLKNSPLTQFIFDWRPLHLIQVFIPTVLISALSYEFFEKQFLRLKRKAQVVPAD